MCHDYFLFLALKPLALYCHSIDGPPKALTLTLTPSTGAQHCYQRSSIHHIKARPLTAVTRPQRLIHTSPSHYAFHSNRSTTPMHISLALSRLYIGSPFAPVSSHRPPFAIEYLSLYPSYLLLSHCLISRPLFNISPSLTSIFSSQLPYL